MRIVLLVDIGTARREWATEADDPAQAVHELCRRAMSAYPLDSWDRPVEADQDRS